MAQQGIQAGFSSTEGFEGFHGGAAAARLQVVWTKFELSAGWVWTLSMGVKGDPARTSVVVAKKPFMGIVSHNTSSWSEPEYDHCNVNSCWELYGVKVCAHRSLG